MYMYVYLYLSMWLRKPSKPHFSIVSSMRTWQNTHTTFSCERPAVRCTPVTATSCAEQTLACAVAVSRWAWLDPRRNPIAFWRTSTIDAAKVLVQWFSLHMHMYMYRPTGENFWHWIEAHDSTVDVEWKECRNSLKNINETCRTLHLTAANTADLNRKTSPNCRK